MGVIKPSRICLIGVLLFFVPGCGGSARAETDAVDEKLRARSEVEGERQQLPDPSQLRRTGDAPEILNAAGLSHGVDAIIAAIRERELELILREQEIAERERSIADLEDIIEERTVELDRIRQRVEERISSWATQEPSRIQQLANVYSSMPAPRAADLLGKLDLDLAVSVLQGMKKKQSAGVLAAMRADRALQISRRMLRPLSPLTDAPAARAK